MRQISAADWPQVRGPEFNGSSPEKNLPGSWSKTENIAWVAEVPSVGATPIVWQNHVFITTVESRSKAMVAIALDRATGKVLWRNVVGLGELRGSAISPVTDGEKVFFMADSGDLVAFEFSGREVWRRNWRKDYAALDMPGAFSPGVLLFENKLYLQLLQSAAQRGAGGGKTAEMTASTLVFDSVSGKSLWQQTQKSTGISAVPPALYPLQTISRSERQVELLSVVGSWLTSRDPKTGAELWRWNAVRAVNEGDLPSLTSGGGITIVLPQKSGIIYALKAGGGNVVWQSGTEELSGGGPAPLFFDGDFFMLDDETKTLLRINAKTGQVKWKMTLPGLVKYTDSPIGADGKVYCWNQAGAILIVSALDGGNLGFLPMGDNGQGTTRLSMAIAQGQLFIGTPTRLYCVGKNDLPLGPTGLSNRSNDPRVGQPEGLKRRLPL